jgi:hypothetical protein
MAMVREHKDATPKGLHSRREEETRTPGLFVWGTYDLTARFFFKLPTYLSLPFSPSEFCKTSGHFKEILELIIDIKQLYEISRNVDKRFRQTA